MQNNKPETVIIKLQTFSRVGVPIHMLSYINNLYGNKQFPISL